MQAHVLGHKKCRDVQTTLVEQEFNDFIDLKKVTFLHDGIKCDILDSTISVVSGGSARANFEADQLMLAEHIHMLLEHSKCSSHNVSATYAACGPRSGRGDCRRVARGGGAGRGGSAGILNGEWDKRVGGSLRLDTYPNPA